jgi:hypothetical protein
MEDDNGAYGLGHAEDALLPVGDARPEAVSSAVSHARPDAGSSAEENGLLSDDQVSSIRGLLDYLSQEDNEPVADAESLREASQLDAADSLPEPSGLLEQDGRMEPGEVAGAGDLLEPGDPARSGDFAEHDAYAGDIVAAENATSPAAAGLPGDADLSREVDDLSDDDLSDDVDDLSDFDLSEVVGLSEVVDLSDDVDLSRDADLFGRGELLDEGDGTAGDEAGDPADGDEDLRLAKSVAAAPPVRLLSVPRPETGEARVDAALSLLDDLTELPVAEHPAVFERVHAQLSEVLGELAAGPLTGPPGRDGG